MLVADLQLPTRLLAGGGPSSPDPRVLRALTTPLIGQFDPAFTAVMDDVVQLARLALLTTNHRCFAVSGLAPAGVEAVLNSLLEPGHKVTIISGPEFFSATAQVARGYGLEISSDIGPRTKLVVAPFVDPTSGKVSLTRELVTKTHEAGAWLLVEASMGLAACELRMDDWEIDVCVAGVEYAIGAPPGMTLVSYTPALEAAMGARATPPRTSYLDLSQLQAYWSPERLNHHTAPTSLVFGLREALRLVLDEGLEARWRRHAEIGQRLRLALSSNFSIEGDLPFSIVQLPTHVDEPKARTALLDDFGVYVTPVGPRSWRVGLLGADARNDAVHRVVSAIGEVLAA